MGNTRHTTLLRALTPEEISALTAGGNIARDWSKVRVSEDFTPEQISRCRLEGDIELESGARLIDSSVADFHIGEQTQVIGVGRMECRGESCFGNGVRIATMNENGGRSLPVTRSLSAQRAYLFAVYRHRPQLLERLEQMAREECDTLRSTMGHIGSHSTLNGIRILRECHIGDRVTIDGASLLENVTLLDDVHIGIDVKLYDTIVAEKARIDNGSILERCFVGENCTIDKCFSGTDSLFFANSHCENGEAAAIFAGPYTTSHHKSSLLIAGMFSFFNAGSGSNQSNHLFKSGPVHQSVHLRGCKFASGGYVMSPALEGAFTMVMGHHTHHHDTSIFPYSYLVERDGTSYLMPAANLASFGSVRDVEKWPQRDKRALQRDVINFEEYNPYVTGAMFRAVNMLNALEDADPDAETYTYKKTVIRHSALQRGVKLYNKAIVAALGIMASNGEGGQYDGSGRWLDIAGQYITRREVERIIADIEAGRLASPAEIDNRFRVFAIHYEDYAYDWALGCYASLIGHPASKEEIAELIQAGENAHDTLRKMTDEDRQRDFSAEMSISYGLDSDDEQERMADFRAVRGI